MSHRATSWAWQQKLPAMQKLVLLALADRHNNDTERCDPSMARIASDCGMSRDSVKRAIDGLREKRLIEAIERKSGTVNLSNYYSFNFTPVGANSTGGGCTQHLGVGAQSTTNLEVEPVIELTPTADADCPKTLFEELEPKTSTEEEVIDHVWKFYQEKLQKPFSKLIDSRKRMIVARYRDCRKEGKTHDEAIEWMEVTIEQLAADDFYNARGVHKGKKKFNDIEYAFRSWKQMERHLNRSNGE